MAENYLTEAFKAMSSLKEELFDINSDGVKGLDAFLDGDTTDYVDIIDTNAESVDELEDSYIGKVILKCPVCTSLVYESPDSITISDTTDMVNVEEECPYCHTQGGFNIVGQVAKYCKDCKKPEDVETDITAETDIDVKGDIDDSFEDDTINEKKKLKESDKPAATSIEDAQKWVDYDMKRYGKISGRTNSLVKKAGFQIIKDDHGDYEVAAGKFECKAIHLTPKQAPLKEEAGDDSTGIIYDNILKIFDKHDIDVEDEGVKNYARAAQEYIEMAQAESDEPYTVEDWFKGTMENYPEDIAELKRVDEKLKESLQSVTVQTDSQTVNVSDGITSIINNQEGSATVSESEEAIEPVTPEVTSEIAAAQDTDDVDVDIEDFDEEAFDEVSEKYFKRVYENVNSYKTTQGSIKGNSLILEGLITFASGKTRPTKFIFEGKDITKTGKARFVGCNKDLCLGDKPFVLRGVVKDKEFITESFAYNYNGKCAKSGENSHCYGTISRK